MKKNKNVANIRLNSVEQFKSLYRLSDKIVDLVRRNTQDIRLKRMHHFFRIMKPSIKEIILDVGGNPELWTLCGFNGQIVLLNLEKHETFRTKYPNWRYIQGDGRCLKFPDKSFDIVFSNSVIEHVGDWDDQKAFAHETRRVGKRYWIQTPNKNFPFEPHFNFPMFQFLSSSIQTKIATFWPFSFPKRYGHRIASDLKEIMQNTRLLTIAEMQILYPDGEFWEERLFCLIKSIVAYRC